MQRIDLPGGFSARETHEGLKARLRNSGAPYKLQRAVEKRCFPDEVLREDRLKLAAYFQAIQSDRRSKCCDASYNHDNGTGYEIRHVDAIARLNRLVNDGGELSHSNRVTAAQSPKSQIKSLRTARPSVIAIGHSATLLQYFTHPLWLIAGKRLASAKAARVW